MYLSQRYSLEDFNEVLDKNNPEVFKIKNKTGEGSFKSYNVFPGVFVVYNDFDMYECSSTFKGDIIAKKAEWSGFVIIMIIYI